MHVTSRHTISTLVLIVGLLPGLFQAPARAVNTLPEELGNAEFWQLSATLSEPDGFFHSDNFVSNERSFQTVISDLSNLRPASAYIGVGPEQNFTYLIGVKPKIAFIVDIRRQNLIEHLMYKALFELSKDRADFLSRLLSRSRPPNVGPDSSIEELFDAFAAIPVDLDIAQHNYSAIRSRLLGERGFPLNAADQASLERVFDAFATGGGNLTYDGPIPNPGVFTATGLMPTFEELMRGTDKEGKHRSFLATEENFRAIQELENKNLIVPVVGNFAGPRALRAVGKYLRDHDATVSAFYTSNVEQYLFMDDSWRAFYTNVATLPLNERSVFIRGVIRSRTGELSPSPALPTTSRYETGLFPIIKLVDAFKKDEVDSYLDMLIDGTVQ